MRNDRKHLTEREVDRLIDAAKGSRNVARDKCLLLSCSGVVYVCRTGVSG